MACAYKSFFKPIVERIEFYDMFFKMGSGVLIILWYPDDKETTMFPTQSKVITSYCALKSKNE